MTTSATATRTKQTITRAIHFRVPRFLGAGAETSTFSTVVPPQCGQATERPAASAGNSMCPPHRSHAHLLYIVSLNTPTLPLKTEARHDFVCTGKSRLVVGAQRYEQNSRPG